MEQEEVKYSVRTKEFLAAYQGRERFMNALEMR
jgi:hypothetical protein